MANVKEYGYYLKGNKIAIVEQDTAFDNDVNSKDYGPGSNRTQWKSPLSSVTDGLEIEYTYAPRYWITDASDTVKVTAYTESSGTGKMELTLNASSSFTAGDYIAIRYGSRLNGLHKVRTTISGATTLPIETEWNGASITSIEATLYKDVNVLNDESDTIPLRPYQIQALECYIRAKVAQDMGEFQLYEYYMKEFRKKLEKDENGRVYGPRITAPGSHSIR